MIVLFDMLYLRKPRGGYFMEDGIISFLDQREVKLLETLTQDYQQFIEPNFLQNKLHTAQEKVSNIVPIKIKDKMNESIKKAAEWDVIQKALKKSGQGFGVVQVNTARLTLDKKKVVKSLYSNSNSLQDFNEICRLRSYEIEKVVVNRRKLMDVPSAFLGGGVTGFFGLYGVPFNLAITFLMYYRTVQSIAIHYGYDVIDDPRELEIASSVTITSLSPGQQAEAETLGDIIKQMMFATSLTSLKESLKKNTYEQMAQKGGVDLLYVQIRALANLQAKKALEKAGKNGVEAGIFKDLLEQLGKMMSKETGKKAVPVIGAVIGSFGDAYTMNKVITGANLIYHKRYLYEKNSRIKLMNDNQDENLIIVDADETINSNIVEGEFYEVEQM